MPILKPAGLIGVLLLFVFLPACKCSCTCKYCEGVSTLTAVWTSNDSLIASRTFTSKTNFYLDAALKDSIKKFNNAYPYPNYKVSQKDSVYNCDERSKTHCEEETPNYYCDCAK